MPPIAIAAALASALIHASWNAALKGGPDTDRLFDAFCIALGSLLIWVVVALIFGTPPAAAWPYIAASTAVHLVYWFALFRGYGVGDMSHVYTLARGSAPLLVALGAILAVQEVPPLLWLAGIVLVSLGVLAVGASPGAPMRATLWALTTGVSIAAYSLIEALGARVSGDALVYVAWRTGTTGVLMAAFVLWRRGPSVMTAPPLTLLGGSAIGVVSFLGFVLVVWAQTIAPIAPVTALRETSVVFGAFIAFLVLRERLGLRRWIGAAIVTVGAGLIAFG
jgi:drug/metabolite transporter (DMT)-like permease